MKTSASVRVALDLLLDAIDEAADGQEAWREHDPYRLILQRAKELNEIVPSPPRGSIEHIAKQFHDTYERLAPDFSYETRKESAVPWDKVPDNNKRLMMAVVAEILNASASLTEIDIFCEELAMRINRMLLNNGPHKPSIGEKVAQIAKELLVLGRITVYESARKVGPDDER